MTLSYPERARLEWGDAMYEVQECGLSIRIHHDNYPRWTCDLFRYSPGQPVIDVSDYAYDPLMALKKALIKIRAKKAIGE